MSDEPTEVLRELWAADEATDVVAELEQAAPPKVCKRMKDVTFDGMAEPGTDLRTAWRDLLQREGKLQRLRRQRPRPGARLHRASNDDRPGRAGQAASPS